MWSEFFTDPSISGKSLTPQNNPWLVLLSVGIAMGAAYLAMELAGQARVHREGLRRHIALAAGSFCLGAGIWSMHFLGMLAVDLCVSVNYDMAWTLSSIVPALGASWVALNLLARPQAGAAQVLGGGLLMGVGIGAMHYMGMAGLEMAPTLRYDPWWFAGSLAAAVSLSCLALWVRFALKAHGLLSHRAQALTSGIIAGLAISATHYLGMAAARFTGHGEAHYIPVSPQMVLTLSLVVALILALAASAFAILAFLHTTDTLEQERDRLRAVMDTAVDGLLTLDSQLRVVALNPAAELLFGWPAREIIGHHVSLIEPPSSLGQEHRILPEALRHAAREQQSQRREMMAMHRCGRLIPIRVSIGSATRDGHSLYVGIVTDITREREAQRRERDARSEVVSFVNALTTHNIYSETDLQGTIIRVNATFCAASGYPQDALIGQNHRIVSSGLHPPHFWAELWRTVKSGRPWSGEICNRTRDQRLYWVDCLIVPVLDEQGQIRRLVSICWDITDRKHNEALLRNTQVALEMSNHAARIGTFEYLPSQARLQMSPLARELLAVDDGLLRSPDLLASLEAVIERSELIDHMLSALEGGTPWDQELRVRHGNGQQRWVRIIGHAERHGGVCERLYGTVQDIDRSKRRELELAEAHELAETALRSKDMFLATMSHELRTPMNAILGFSQVLELDEGLHHDQRRYVDEILRAGHHLLDLINDVLDLAKINAGRLEVSHEAVPLSKVLQDCANLLSPMARNRRIAVHVADAGQLTVWADRVRLKQVILNLMSNAVKYNREGGLMSIDVLVHDHELEIRISDTGCGIDAEHLPRLFEPFSRLQAENSGIEGTGIGLAITQLLVDRMGGRIQVRSEVGQGSAFSVWLKQGPLLAQASAGPLAPKHSPSHTGRNASRAIQAEPFTHPAQRAHEPHPAQATTAECDATSPPAGEALPIGSPPRAGLNAEVNLRVLCIDDNAWNVGLVKSALDDAGGFIVEACRTPESGIETALSFLPHLILLELQLPGLDGYETLEILRESPQLAQVPVIAVCSGSAGVDEIRARAAGFHACLTKPVTEDASMFWTSVNSALATTMRDADFKGSGPQRGWSTQPDTLIA